MNRTSCANGDKVTLGVVAGLTPGDTRLTG
jgi:hypothetical protein